jgi:2'-5' RNA ligase
LIRSFLAIELPRAILKKIEEIEAALRSTHADVRWVNPEKIHLTLKFFGNIEESKIDSILKSIEEPAQNTAPFSLKVKGVGAFPNLKNPRVIWMGLVDGKEILTSLQKQIEKQLEKIGFQAEDRPFHPHLTLGRMKLGRGKEDLMGRMEKHKEEEFGVFPVERMILFKSDLKPTGPIYTPLKEMKLGGQSTSEEIGR